MSQSVISTTGIIDVTIGASKVKSLQASSYRLLQKADGTIVLQGAFGWTEGVNGGYDWEDIPTIIEEPEK